MMSPKSVIQPMPVYLDCAATTPLDPRVRAEMLRYLDDDFGNAGSRTHELGQRRPQRGRTGPRSRRGGRRLRRVATSSSRAARPKATTWRFSALPRRSRPAAATRLDGDRASRRARAARGAVRGAGSRSRSSPPGPDGAVDADAVLARRAARHAARQRDARQQRDRRRFSRSPRWPIGSTDPRRVFHVDAAQGFGQRARRRCAIRAST